MPQPKSISPGKGREALWQKVQISRINMVRLNRTYYSLLKFTSKIFIIVSPSQIPANYANSVQFAHTVREFHKIRTIRLTYYTLCFRHLSQAENPAEFQQITRIPRNLPTQSANSAKFSHF